MITIYTSVEVKIGAPSVIVLVGTWHWLADLRTAEFVYEEIARHTEGIGKILLKLKN